MAGALAVRAYFLVSGCTGGWVQYISDDRGSPFVHLRSLSELLVSPERYKGTSLAMFAADFSRLRPRQANLFVPGCGQEGTQRGRPLHGSPQDQADRLRIHQAVGTPGL